MAIVLQNEIARAGVIAFARFMELALYDCDHGYYRKSHIGKAGDFFTNVSVGPLFGQMLAHHLSHKLAPLRGEIHIVEAGAHHGSLAADILNWLAANRPEFAQRLRYFIVEPIPELQQCQREKILVAGAAPPAPNVAWVPSLEDLPAIRGAIISNELLDAFPVHIFKWHSPEQRWREYGVNSDFQFSPMDSLPAWAQEALTDLKAMQPYLPDYFTIELSPAAEEWWTSAAKKLTEGFLLAVDYGDESTALWSPARAPGTVRAFRNHKLVPHPLANPGEQDITASVNFTRIRIAGERAGLISTPLETQAQFLTKIAAEFFTNPTSHDTRQFQTLTHPEHLGRSFKVLVQSRTSS